MNELNCFSLYLPYMPNLIAQQTFVFMKTSSRRLEDVFGLRLHEDVFKTSWKRLHQDQHIRLGHTSSRRLENVFIKINIFVLVIRPQDIFNTSSRCFENVFKTSSRQLQDVFRTYYQVKLFLVTQFSILRLLREVFKTFLRRTAKTII